MKKCLLSMLLIIALLISFASAADALPDVSIEGDTELSVYEIAARLTFANIWSATDDIAAYDMPVSRVAAAVLISRAAGFSFVAEFVDEPPPFIDVPGWATGEISHLYGAGIIRGAQEGYFMPDDPITAAAFCTMLLRLLGYSDGGADADFTYDNALSFAADTGLIDKTLAGDIQSNGFSAEHTARILHNALCMPAKGETEAFAYTTAARMDASYDRITADVLTGANEVFHVLLSAANAVRTLDSYTISQHGKYIEETKNTVDRSEIESYAYVDRENDRMRIVINIDGMDDDDSEDIYGSVLYSNGRFYMKVADGEWADLTEPDDVAGRYYMNLYNVLFGPAYDYCRNLEAERSGDEIILKGFCARANLLLDITSHPDDKVDYYYDFTLVFDARTYLPIRAEVTYNDIWPGESNETSLTVDFNIIYKFGDFNITKLPEHEKELIAILDVSAA